jgi:hypothetical protein
MGFDGEKTHQGSKFFFFGGGVTAAITAASVAAWHLYTLDPCFHVISSEHLAQNKH